MSTGRNVLLVGATGLVGQECLRLLVQDSGVSSIRVLARRPVNGAENPKVQAVLTDFSDSDLSEHPEWFAVDQVFCALGTTMAQAQSKEGFREVDHGLPLKVAKAARKAGAQHFLLVSAMGANERSLFFYNRVKGELEEDLLILGYPAVTIARPSLLLGQRVKPRFGETLASQFSFLMPKASAPVHAWQVALGLVQASSQPASGVKYLSNQDMRKLQQ